METMQDWFGLKEGHNDFAIETDEDARLFFARQELEGTLMSMLRRSFRTGNPPKMVLYGDWGVGKTHTMRHIEHVIEMTGDYPAIVVFKELPDIKKRSSFQVAHSALLDALGYERTRDWITKFMQSDPQDYLQRIQEWTQSEDIANAFKILLIGGDTSRSAWDWLRGIPLSAADMKATQLGPALSQSNEYVRVLQMLGRLCRLVEDRMLIFMLDETNKLLAIQDHDATNQWVNAFKLIADQQTKEIGLILSNSCTDMDDMAIPLLDEQVRTRFGHSNYILLTTMDEAETREFMSHLLAEWIDNGKRDSLLQEYDTERDSEDVNAGSFPFTQGGLKKAAEWACRNGGISRPRDIQQTIDDFLNRAIDDERHILSSEFMQSQITG